MATEALARARPWPSTSARVTAGNTVIGLLVAAGAAALTVSVSGLGIKSGVATLIVVAGTLWSATTRRTSLALALLMIYLGALDGYLKLSTGSTSVTFVRDGLLYAIVIGVLVRAILQGKRFATPPLSPWVIGFAVLVLVQLANPLDGSLLHSLGGVRQDLEFVPLFFLTFAFVRTTKALLVFVILLVLLAVANGAANFVQFHMSPQQLAAWGPGYAERVLAESQFQFAGRTFETASGQAVVRPFGLMSESGSGGLVDAFALGAMLALASMPTRRRYLAPAAIGAVAVVAGVITSQGRAVVVCSVVVLLAYILMTVTSRRVVATVLSLAAIAAVASVTVSIIASSHSAVFRYHGVSTSQIQQARGASYAAIPHNLTHYPLGAGLGAAGPGEGYSGAPAATGVADAETEFSYATLEAGIPGMVVLVGFTLVLFVIGLRRVRQEPDRETRALLAAIVAPLAGIVALYTVSAVTPTTPGGPYLWAVGGIVSYWLVARPAALRREAAAVVPTRPKAALLVGTT
ncbi:MAG: hypothetical protein ACLP0J_06475 [Solirubrobacteraceae bacterium]